MRVLNIGSLNLDIVYAVDHIVQEAETISTSSLQRFCGGKGLNQSIALARAGAEVAHAGCVGSDGENIQALLAGHGVGMAHLRQVDGPSGHAIIQVDQQGQNAIIVHGGANHQLTRQQVDVALASMAAGDILLLQNETNLRDYIMQAAAQRGLQVALNPSPVDEGMRSSPAMDQLSYIILNEVEGQYLSNQQEPEVMCRALRSAYPHCVVVLTLGSEGAMYYDGQRLLRQAAYRVPAVDTTAAGDTFTGYFLACVAGGRPPQDALRLASKAAAIAVSRQGATASIPTMAEVEAADMQPV